ncbi:MAG: hypothetical protein KAT34_08265 [Candidatus Aminicenantes bacterium]|jgi:hypothetical protein|nr:hypothetical protein [Candidatus Aminicenantes bacterium]
MKQEKVEKKLGLNKETIQKLQTGLSGEELKEIKGGTDVVPMGTTNIPPLCT